MERMNGVIAMNKNWHGKKNRNSLLMNCSVLSELVLFHGKKNINQDLLDELWKKKKYKGHSPALSTIKQYITTNNIKWYINNYIDIEDSIWNGSFIHGLSYGGKCLWNRYCFPSFKWHNNSNIYDNLMQCPFYGDISVYNHAKGGNDCFWKQVPALYLKYNNDDISFLAGVLSTGKIVDKGDFSYASYSKKSADYLRECGIPIECSTKSEKYNYISPFWTALFSVYMPNNCSYWNNIKNGYMSEIYSAILWRMYVSNGVLKKSFPYLKSRRWVYMNLGTIYETEKKWLSLNLSKLDQRIKKVIHLYAKDV